MDRILVSACLIGWPVRFDGGAKTIADDRLAVWAEEGRLVPLCPEIAAGLATPRPPIELAPGTTAADLLAGSGDALAADGSPSPEASPSTTWAAALREGARIALATARVRGCRYALLAEGSPSCGVDAIADGTFSGTRIPGRGVVAQALRDAGIEVFADVSALAARLAETT